MPITKATPMKRPAHTHTVLLYKLYVVIMYSLRFMSRPQILQHRALVRTTETMICY
jgi:hypothetical protein